MYMCVCCIFVSYFEISTNFPPAHYTLSTIIAVMTEVQTIFFKGISRTLWFLNLLLIKKTRYSWRFLFFSEKEIGLQSNLTVLVHLSVYFANVYCTLKHETPWISVKCETNLMAWSAEEIKHLSAWCIVHMGGLVWDWSPAG